MSDVYNRAGGSGALPLNGCIYIYIYIYTAVKLEEGYEEWWKKLGCGLNSGDAAGGSAGDQLVRQKSKLAFELGFKNSRVSNMSKRKTVSHTKPLNHPHHAHINR